jgi:hypothetical protein
MRMRVKSLGVLVSALLVTCLLSWPQEAKKGPDKPAATNPEIQGTDLLFPPGFDDLSDKIYYESRGATSKPKKASALSLRLYGGLSRLAAGDVNEGSDGYFELLELYEAMGAGSASGSYSPLHTGYNFGADIVFQLSPMIGVGIGAGYLQSSKTSQMTFSMISIDGGVEFTLTGTPKLRAVPVRLAVFFTLPLSGKLSLTADAGGTYYAALKLDASQRLESSDGMWQTQSLSASRSNLSDNLGFQGSLGFEYKISQKMGFFIEAVGRYASFKNFDTATGTSQSSGGVPETDVGKIYLETITYSDLGSWSWFIVSADPPTPEPPDLTYREPKIDLGGFSLQAGIRIRL